MDRLKLPNLHTGHKTRTKADRPPLPQTPRAFERLPFRRLPDTDPARKWLEDKELPSPSDVPQVMRFCIRHDGQSGAELVQRDFENHRGRNLVLRLGCPAGADRQDAWRDEDMPSLIEWIDRWEHCLPGSSIELDLSGNSLSANRLKELGDCLRRHPRIEALDLSRNAFVVPAPQRKRTLTKAQTIQKACSLRSPRTRREAEPELSSGEAIAALLAFSHLQQIRLNDNPFRRVDRTLIIGAIGKCPALHTVGMANCGLSEEDIATLVRLGRQNQWRHLAMGATLSSRSVQLIATHLLAGNKTLVTLDLGTREKHAWLDVATLFGGLIGNQRLQALSLAGHVLQGKADTVTEAIRQATSLRELDLSRCEIHQSIMEALKNALERKTRRPNETLTRLVLPTFDGDDIDTLEKQIWARGCSIAIERNRTLAQSRDRAAMALYAGFRSLHAPMNELSPGLCRQIVAEISDLECLHHLDLVRHRPPRSKLPPGVFPPLPPLPPLPSQPPRRRPNAGKP